MQSKFKYAYWRDDKPKEPGYSHELISVESKKFCETRNTDLDTLDGILIPGCDTVIKCLQKQADEIPNNDFLGTRVGNKYEWMSFQKVNESAKAISLGFKAFGMIPDVKAEGKDWRFVGIQAKN